MTSEKTYQKLHSLMASYVPEFSYDLKNTDPGSVLTTLCAEMVAESEKNFEHVQEKHKIQYLNLFEELKKEPVSAAKGYVKFLPVSGYEGDIQVAAGTQVMCSASKTGEIVFETMHDLSVTQAQPEVVVMTDKDKDVIIRHDYDVDAKEAQKQQYFRAFDIEGENQSCHKVYLCFDEMLDYLQGLDLYLKIEMNNEEEQEESMELLASDLVEWSILNELGEKILFDSVEAHQDGLRLVKADIIPQKYTYDQKSGYYLMLEAKKELPELYVSRISLGFRRQELQPEELIANGISEPIGAVLPFGKPLNLYQEFVIVSREAFSKKGAGISLDFELDYVIHEEVLEVPEMDLEYKTIMKKPKKVLEMQSSKVGADYVVWEYLSKTGWKQIWKEEHIATMFNGSTEGHVRLDFICPDDIEDDVDRIAAGNIRARLLRANNIYKVPAIYTCPRIMNLKISYSYMDGSRYADYALLKNNFDEQDVTRELEQGAATRLFYSGEHDRRSMYMGFSNSLAGTPISIYFDLENYNDVPIDFTVEYLSPYGFRKVKTVDSTDGMLGSGNLLLMIPKDVKQTRLYGYDGYFLRFINYNNQIKEYALPVIKGIYMNMAKVVNSNIITEEVYIEDIEQSVDIQLSQENLIQAQVWANEMTDDGENWVLWEERPGFYQEGRNYQLDRVQGTIHIDKQTLINAKLSAQGPHFRVKHCNYTGAQANLEEGRIDTMRNSVRYINGVTNPFPTYGGYDGYTMQSAQKLVTSMLYTRNRAVSARDYYHIISQTSFGVRRVKCACEVDLFGNPAPNTVTVAVLIEEYEKGMQIFSELKEDIRKNLLERSGLVPTGKELLVTQPHFIRVNVRLWLEKENMERAYELQNAALVAIREFIDPLDGGMSQNGWEIGDFPRSTQIAAYLRTHLEECEIAKLVMTADVDGKEVPIGEEFYEQWSNPFMMAVNGEHIVYIDIA